jgi:outer membrane biosynthesis protein TonB
MMADPDNEPAVPEPQPEPEPEPQPEPTRTEPSPPPPIVTPPQAPQRTVGGVHDLSDHPAVLAGQVLNTGDTVYNRDPNAPAFNRPVLIDEGTAERTTTTSNPAKRTVKGKTKSDGAGPES